MTLDEAIQKALDYERQVLAIYQAAAAGSGGVGQSVFSALAQEEQGHVDYLEAKRREWADHGHVTAGDLETALPPGEAVAKAVAAKAKALQSRSPEQAQSEELELLKRALVAETETSAFYEEMVATLDTAGQALFEPFLKIERGHRALVQAEIDALTGTGFWFDVAEFRFEAG